MSNLTSSALAEPDRSPVDYKLGFERAAQHQVVLEATFPCANRSSLEVFMPVWTPGSYLVREYARHLESFQATGANDKKLNWSKTRKNRWKIECSGETSVTLRYSVYCRELSVRTSLVEDDKALLNGATIFLSEVGNEKRPYNVKLNLPAAWTGSYSGLQMLDGHYVAKNFDELVDCPILAGSPNVYDIEVKKVQHRLVNFGEASVWDGPKSQRDVQRIVDTTTNFWGSLPYSEQPPGNYHFFNVLGSGGGGLEHSNSTFLMASRYAQRNRKDYLGWLSLVAHEYFHAWNVKRLRPKALGPFDYENEAYTPSLWIAEGITAYYDDLLVRRAQFSTDTEYLEILSKHINDLQSTAGRQVQSLRESSYDAWIKFYRPDENSANSSISYYVKGPVVAFLLDAEIRAHHPNSDGLNEVMRRAYKKYSGPQGYTEDEFRAVAEEVAGVGLKGFFSRYVDGHDELDYASALKTLGLRFKKPDTKDQDLAWWGLDAEVKAGTLSVKSVKRGSPAEQAGISAEDEILAFDDLRVPPDKEKLEERLKRYRKGQNVQVLVSRREQLRRFNVTFGSKPLNRWQLEVDPEASEQSKRQLRAWLGNATVVSQGPEDLTITASHSELPSHP
jgi:predicted metalloprotease with PDZ domain